MSVNKNNNNTNEFPLYLFYQGKNYEAYKFFGVHSMKKGRSKVFISEFGLLMLLASLLSETSINGTEPRIQ